MSIEDSPHFYIAEWSSSVARRAPNPKGVGSNPASATNVKQAFAGFADAWLCFYTIKNPVLKSTG